MHKVNPRNQCQVEKDQHPNDGGVRNLPRRDDYGSPVSRHFSYKNYDCSYAFVVVEVRSLNVKLGSGHLPGQITLDR